jgi:hypothetical protein
LIRVCFETCREITVWLDYLRRCRCNPGVLAGRPRHRRRAQVLVSTGAAPDALSKNVEMNIFPSLVSRLLPESRRKIPVQVSSGHS